MAAALGVGPERVYVSQIFQGSLIVVVGVLPPASMEEASSNNQPQVPHASTAKCTDITCLTLRFGHRLRPP